MTQLVVMTSDKYLWALQPFFTQKEKYLPSYPAHVYGFKAPEFALPPGNKFISLGHMINYPSYAWTNALEDALYREKDEVILLMLEDYWLSRWVDVDALETLSTYIKENADVLCVNVTSDRVYRKETREYGYVDRFDLVESLPTAPWHITLQAGLWHRERLLTVLSNLPDPLSPWQLEDRGDYLAETYPSLKLLGTRQVPMRYVIGIRAGHFSLDGSWQYPPTTFTEEDYKILQQIISPAKITA